MYQCWWHNKPYICKLETMGIWQTRIVQTWQPLSFWAWWQHTNYDTEVCFSLSLPLSLVLSFFFFYWKLYYKMNKRNVFIFKSMSRPSLNNYFRQLGSFIEGSKLGSLPGSLFHCKYIFLNKLVVSLTYFRILIFFSVMQIHFSFSHFVLILDNVQRLSGTLTSLT